MITLEDKIKEAERTLKLASDMSDYYYHKPLIICYSGGKDSDVMLDIAVKCLKPDEFEVLNSHTTVDAPETVYHIRKVFDDLRKKGIKATIHMPMYKGKPTSMWRLIEEKTIPPTRRIRYCCEVLKESTVPNRMIAVGVREDESRTRANRETFGVLEPRRNETDWRTTGHTYAMFKLDQTGGEDAYQCKMITACKEHRDTMVNPIYRFTEENIWEYVKKFDVLMNPLYAKGYKRVGCVGCPLGGHKSMIKEFQDYPKYKENYIKAFDKMLANRRAVGKRFLQSDLKTGEEVMRWWLGEDPKQIRIEDLITEERTETTE